MLVIVACSNKDKYDGNWVITNINYKDSDITRYITTLRNMSIDVTHNEYCTTPIVSYQEFDDSDITFKVSNKLKRLDGKNLIIIQGSQFFTDTFEVQCVSQSCCQIVLRNRLKEIQLIYNGGLSYFERRNCPYLTNEYVDSLVNM